jgi:exodeoxyribonuclease V beta subunit
MNKLDVNSKVLNLEGVSLVEAGAGSGKTYSITKIVLRAILDNYKISDILLVTFTEAAVKELRSRLRKELSEFYKVLISGNIKHSEVYKDFPVESNKEVINYV